MARKRKPSQHGLEKVREFEQKIDHLIACLEAGDPEAADASRAFLIETIPYLGEHGLQTQLVAMKVLTNYVAQAFYEDSSGTPKRGRPKAKRK